jgi:sugar (pentulose or hexulose) kinase
VIATGNAIGIDVGTTGLKAVAVDAGGKLLREKTVRYPTRLAGLGAEQDAEAWWDAAIESLPEVVGGEPVSGVAVTCQAPTLVCVDANVEPLGAALTWIDRRAGEEAREIAEATRPTRNPPDPYFGTAKLLWLARNRPEEIRGASAVLCANGFIVGRLTGEFSFDETTAGLFQGWDGDFDPALADLVPLELLPEARPAMEVAGGVSRAAAVATTLPEGTPVVHGGIDAVGAALEAGIFGTGDGLVEMTGFSTVVITAAERRTRVPGMIHTRHGVGEGDLILAAMVTAGAVTDWGMRLTGFENPAAFDRNVSERIPERPGRLLMVPALAGERTPTWDATARGAVVGLDLDVDAADLALAIYEGTALGLGDNFGRLQEVLGDLSPVRSVGGGSKSESWTQIKADVLGVPVTVPRLGHGAAAGAAMLAGMATGLWPDEGSARALVAEEGSTFEPDPEMTDKYAERLELYRDLQGTLPPITRALQGLKHRRPPRQGAD